MSERRVRATHVAVLCAVLSAGAFARPGGIERAADWNLSIAPVTSPANGSSAQPQITIQGDQAVLSWLERDGPRATLRFAERTAAGWSEPRTVVFGDDFFVNWADVPSVLRLADGALAAHWLQKSGSGTYAYDVRLSWSRDNGRTWTPSVTPHHDGTKTEHGFASLFQAPDAGLGLVWLDGRTMSPGAHDGHGGKNSGAMSVRAVVFDPDGSQRSEMVVDPRVCECCPTATAVTSEGVIAAFRDRTGDEVRDIYVARFVAGKWTEPAPVHQDHWKIAAACPVNGPALMADGSAVVSWIEFANQRAQYRVRRVDRAGTRSPSVTVAGIGAGRASGYPRIARRGNELLFAWTETSEGASRVLTAAARLPASPVAAKAVLTVM